MHEEELFIKEIITPRTVKQREKGNLYQTEEDSIGPE